MKEITIKLNKKEIMLLKNLLTLRALDISEELLKIANNEKEVKKEELRQLKENNEMLNQIFDKLKGEERKW